MNSATYHQRIREKLQQALRPTLLDVVDDSARHKGHAGADAQGETHFKVVIVSARFSGLPRLARHRLVYEILAAELQERVHALNIDAKAPEEA